jgi:adhesin transport system outer membrane protein
MSGYGIDKIFALEWSFLPLRIVLGTSHLMPRALTCATAMFVLQLAGCTDAPLEISEMREVIGTTLSTESKEYNLGKPVARQGGLRTSLARAVEANDAYRAMIAMEAEAFANIAVADSARQIHVSTTANLGGVSESGTTTTGVAAALNLSRLLYDAGESAAAVNLATAQALATQSERQIRGNELALEAARAWIDVWQFSARIALLSDKTAEMDTLVGQIERMASNGMIDRSILEGVRRRVVDISLEKMQLEANLQDAQTRFQRYFDTSAGNLEPPSEIVDQGLAHRMAKSWEEAPSLHRQAAELVIALNNVSIAEAAFKPRAYVEGAVRTPTEPSADVNSTLGVSLTYTFGDGGKREANLRAAQARFEAARAQLADLRHQIEAEIGTATTRLTAMERSIPLMAENIRLSAAEAEIARTQIVTGQSNLQRLIEAEIDNYRARDNEIAMQAEKLILQLTIAALTGGLGRELGLEPSAQ